MGKGVREVFHLSHSSEGVCNVHSIFCLLVFNSVLENKKTNGMD